MAEKVIFEFRVTDDEKGRGFCVRHDGDCAEVFAPILVTGCQEGPVPWVDFSPSSRRHHRNKQKARRHTRHTLDFFERVYDDLFRDKESGGGEKQSTD
jgi:hypothetical protein